MLGTSSIMALRQKIVIWIYVIGVPVVRMVTSMIVFIIPINNLAVWAKNHNFAALYGVSAAPTALTDALVADLVDAPDLGSGVFGREGSSPFRRTYVSGPGASAQKHLVFSYDSNLIAHR